MNLRSIDGIIGIISIPLSLFGIYISYLMYVSGDIAHLTLFGVMTTLTMTKAINTIRGRK